MIYKLGSLFDGSGGFPLAGALCGIEPTWAAEVEPYPIAVTRSRFDGDADTPLLKMVRKHHPELKLISVHLGNVCEINGAEIEPVDIITFGSPCQDLSVAGKRAGLKHAANGDEETTRSGLFMEAVRIIKEMREATNGRYPTFALWENVPGAFSSNNGEDFRVVCEELIKIVEPTAVMPSVPKGGWAYADSYCGDRWSLAYRVFDAQYWGVPQRRRRIHLVVDFRGERAREVLFEREGVRGYFAQVRAPWQTAAGDAQNCVGADDRAGEVFDGYNGDLTGDVSATLGVNCGVSTGRNGVIERGRGLDAVKPICMATQQGGAEIRTDDKAPTVTAAAGMSGNNQPVVAYTLKIRSGCAIDSAGKAAGKGPLVQVDKAATLSTVQDQYLFAPAAYGVTTKGNGDAFISEERHTSLGCGGGQAGQGYPCAMQPTAYSFDSLASNSMKSSNPHSGCRQVEVAKTLDTTDPNPSKNQGGIAIVEAVKCYDIGEARLRTPSEYTEISPTLTARCGTGGNNVPAVIYKTYDARGNGDGEIANTLTGDHNNRITDYTSVVVESAMVFDGSSVTSPINASNPQPGAPCHTLSTDSRNYVVYEEQPVYCLQGNGIDRADTAGCNGAGWREGASYTLNTIDRPAVVYAVDQGGGKSSANVSENTAPTLCTTHGGEPAVAYGLDRASFNQGQNAKFDFSVTEEQQPTLVAKGPGAVAYLASGKQTTGTLMASMATKQCLGDQEAFSGDYHIIEERKIHYIVRRLTPTECARLQGFDDRWGDINHKDSFTDEEYLFWLDVRNTHAAINGKAVKDYTKEQMLKWYNNLHTDSAEYKMWGNGIALPPALYCMQGIAEALKSENTNGIAPLPQPPKEVE